MRPYKRIEIFSGITGNIFIMGVVSLFTDLSSQMIFPLIPLFLTTVCGVASICKVNQDTFTMAILGNFEIRYLRELFRYSGKEFSSIACCLRGTGLLMSGLISLAW